VFVPFIKKVNRSQCVSRQNALSRNYELGKIRILITAISPLHFGQGKIIADTDTSNGKIEFIHALNRENGCIALPGSSFKGMLRAFFEAITQSCVLFFPKNKNIKNAMPNENLLPYNSNSKGLLCPACSIFGCSGYKGKLNFSSFYACKNASIENYNIPQLQSPFKDYPKNKYRDDNGGYGNERLYYGVLPAYKGSEVGNLTKEQFFREKNNKKNSEIQFYGRKFYKHANKQETEDASEGNIFECLEPGETLEGTITYQGLKTEELAALVFALGMGWAPPIYHKLGYAKPAYFGSVLIKIEAIDMPERYKNIGIARNTQDLQELAKQYRTRVSEDVLNTGNALNAIEVFEQTWTSLEEPSQWSLPQEGGQIKMY